MAQARQPRTAAADAPVEPKQADKSLGQLVGEMSAELGSLMRAEVQLAKVELKDEVTRATKAGGMLGAGALTGYFALLFGSLALAWLLDAVMPTALAFFVVAVLYGVAAAVLVTRGRTEIKQVDPVPRQTVETLKEDVEWAKAQKSKGARSRRAAGISPPLWTPSAIGSVRVGWWRGGSTGSRAACSPPGNG